ncbi:hypothetical protein DAEQUDRAFT_741379 [Daedalea quercina L-15889]|uniref:Uncharacterized protein n=1 Tax=Daedalea quercina L-15889 TaxID=1314783 RepID=A0A165LED5_9APHY|nr:hypothetical protein DAEQUDRAFT_741379 [Daedalea quercina L-15889]
MSRTPEQDHLEQLVQDITELSKKLPGSVPEATKDDKIYTVMTSVTGNSHWGTFNRRFDILFGEDCRNEEGRLHYIRRGRHGMAKVTSYLNRVIVDENTLKGFYTPATVKLERLKAELEVLAIQSNKSSNRDQEPRSPMLAAAATVITGNGGGQQSENSGHDSALPATGDVGSATVTRPRQAVPEGTTE